MARSTRTKNQPPTDENQRRRLERLDRSSYWTDNNFQVPFTNIRFGLDPLIGLIPGIGDFAGLILSLYVYREAIKADASSRVKRRMIANMLIKFVFGLIPVAADSFDVVFKANTRNTGLLRR